jgi:hypothetical protein
MDRRRSILTLRFALIAALLAPLSANAQTLDEARAFVRGLYAAYEASDPDYLGRNAEKTFAPDLLALIRRDAATAPPGEVGILDGDPICDCQDYSEIELKRLNVGRAGQGRARAEVSLHFPGETRSMRLDLVAVGGQWRVADVHTSATPSLVKLLATELGRRPPKP